MARIEVKDDRRFRWQIGGESMPPEEAAKLTEAQRQSRFRIHAEGSESAPQLMEIQYPPDAVIDVHAHLSPEIIYIVGGEMRVGNRSLTAGSSLSISGRTLYGFAAGPEGLTILVFRPHSDRSNFSPEQLKAYVANQPASAEPERGR